MISSEQQTISAPAYLQIVWRNPRAHVRASLRARQASDLHCQWAEQAGKIRARQSNWDTNDNWVE
jgi:hypothetical protein